jgi:tripartite-type tricarboxylate transporter receptor subunit TctC
VVRAATTEASKVLGQPIVVENRPGANQRLAIAGIKKAAPDGYTIALVNDAVMTTHVIADPSFTMVQGKDYEPVGFLLSFPLLLVTHSSLPFRDLRGLLDYARTNPGKLNMVGGPGSITQTTFERIKIAANVDWTFIPYKDSNQAMPDLLEGRVHGTISGVLLRPGLASGKVVPIATTGTQRWAAFPDVPTLQESGINASVTAWYGLVTTAGTPRDAIQKLNAAYQTGLRVPEVDKRIRDNSQSTGVQTTEGFADFIRAEIAAWTPVIKAAGIKIE